jgi:hypothetical protein
MAGLSSRFLGACVVAIAVWAAGAAQSRTLHLLLQTERGLTLVDSDTIKTDGDYAEGWVSVFLAHHAANAAYVLKSHLRFDCAGARWQILETDAYNRALVQISADKAADPQWTDVLPKTNQIPEIMAVCFGDFGGGKKPLPASTTDKYLLDLVDKASR